MVEAEPDVDVRPLIFNGLAKANLPILSMQAVDLSLEDIFLEVTAKDRKIASFADIDESSIEIVAAKKETNKEDDSDESNL